MPCGRDRGELRDDSFERRQTEADFLKERIIVWHEDETWVLRPQRAKFAIQLNRLLDRLVADRIPAFDAVAADGCALEKITAS